jgi:hypothetical protein
MVNIIVIKLSSVLPLVWTEPAAKKTGARVHKGACLLAWQIPTLDRQPFTTMDYKESKQQVVIVLNNTDAGD